MANDSRTWSLVINGDSEHAVPLCSSSCLIGRSDDCDVVLKQDNVSRKHARLSLHDNCWMIEDLASTNGVRINGEKICPGQNRKVRAGDEIMLSNSVSLRIKECVTGEKDVCLAEKDDEAAKDDAETAARIRKETILAFLPVVDSIERGIETFSGEQDSPYLLGLRQIRKQALDQLEKMGATQIAAEGMIFDPRYHNAISHVTDRALPQNTVSRVILAGYRLDGKVLRFASVIVAN